MYKHIAPSYLYPLPSGVSVHPCRLILKDGSLMWKHALLSNNNLLSLPYTEAHEAHIIKTAQRVEELNAWVSQDLEPWECLLPIKWYDPSDDDLSEGIALYMYHVVHPIEFIYSELNKHILEHEVLEKRGSYLFFKRC